MMGDWGYGMMGWFGGGLYMLLVLGGLAALVALLIRAADSGGNRTGGAAVDSDLRHPPARAILDMRYARGELTQAE